MPPKLETIPAAAIPAQRSTNEVTLRALFQVVTCCCVFFAVLRFSPSLALTLTIVVAPALIRTAFVSEIMRRDGQSFTFQSRFRVFLSSVGLVLMTIGFAVVAFVLVSLVFGLLGMLFGFAISSTDYIVEAGIIGTVGGMIWGLAGAVFAVFFAMCKYWNPRPSPIKR